MSFFNWFSAQKPASAQHRPSFKPRTRKHSYRPRLEPLEARRLLTVMGDFNGDGYDDLAIGAPDADFNGLADAGVVHIMYGSASGLTAAGNQLWNQDSPGILDSAEAGDRFGSALVKGDFNGDRYTDLAISAMYEDLGSVSNAGAVHVLYGSPSGLTAAGNQLWTQNVPGIEDSAETSDYFGTSLAAGDLNGDGRDELAIGVPTEDITYTRYFFGRVPPQTTTYTDAGAVHVLYGSAAGLTSSVSQYWTQDSTGILDSVENSDYFGHKLAMGDFNGDGRADLAIGAFHESLGNVSHAGAVHVLYGWTSGLSSANNQFWTQDSYGIADQAEANDYFGLSLAAGDFNGDGRDELAIGVPFEDVGTPGGTASDAGVVHALYGSADGLIAMGNQYYTQQDVYLTSLGDTEDPGIAGTEASDMFGRTLLAGDFTGDGRDELVIAVPYEDTSLGTDTGGFHVLFGSSFGLYGQEDTMHSKTQVTSLAAGDFNGDGRAELITGQPERPNFELGVSSLSVGARFSTQFFSLQNLGFFPSPGDRVGSVLA